MKGQAGCVWPEGAAEAPAPPSERGHIWNRKIPSSPSRLGAEGAGGSQSRPLPVGYGTPDPGLSTGPTQRSSPRSKLLLLVTSLSLHSVLYVSLPFPLFVPDTPRSADSGDWKSAGSERILKSKCLKKLMAALW